LKNLHNLYLGTQINFQPGLIHGGDFEVDCGLNRCLSYFMEPLIMLAPFCKHPINLRLRGITNSPNELSVDAINSTWLPVFSRFVLADSNAAIKVNR
jgi:RNA 3'-terminal phosphate cyclase